MDDAVTEELSKVTKDKESKEWWFRKWRSMSVVIVAASGLSSFFATIMALFNFQYSNYIVAIFAGVPAALIILDRAFVPADRSAACQQFTFECQKLENKAKYENITAAQIAEEYEKIKENFAKSVKPWIISPN